MIHTVLLSILLKLIKAVFSIGTPNRLILRNHAALVTLVSSEFHVVLKITHWLVVVRILFATEVIRSTSFRNWKNLISFSNISEQFGIWLMFSWLVGAADIWVILLGEASVLLLNLLWCSSRWNVKNRVVVFLQNCHCGRSTSLTRGKAHSGCLNQSFSNTYHNSRWVAV